MFSLLPFFLLFLFSPSLCTVNITVNVKSQLEPWNHFWEESVGSGHALLALVLSNFHSISQPFFSAKIIKFNSKPHMIFVDSSKFVFTVSLMMI